MILRKKIYILIYIYIFPIGSMYGIFTYTKWLIFVVNVGKYTIHKMVCYIYVLPRTGLQKDLPPSIDSQVITASATSRDRSLLALCRTNGVKCSISIYELGPHATNAPVHILEVC